MTEHKTDNSLPDELPQAAVQTRKRQFSIVWLVPLVALLIGAWLVYKAFSENLPKRRGPGGRKDQDQVQGRRARAG